MPCVLFLRDIGSAIGRDEAPFPALGEPSPYSPRSRSTLFGALTRSISGCVVLSRSFELGSLFSRLMLRPSSIAASRAFTLSGSTRFERRDALAGDGLQLLLQRRPVVGDELGAVA